MITGRKAFEAPSRAGLIAAILNQQPAPVSDDRRVPAALVTVGRR
jgi:hypothetical protein